MRCPICKKPVSLNDPYMPFCSERCQLIDLANWLDEKYVISTPIEPGAEIDDSSAEENGGERERD